MRGYRLCNNAVRDGVRQRALQALPYLDTHASIMLGHYQDCPVIHSLAAELPCFSDANAELLNFFRLSGGYDEHRDLTAFLGLEVPELGLDARHGFARQGPREIGHSRGQGRNGHFCPDAVRTQQQGEPSPHTGDAAKGSHAGAGPIRVQTSAPARESVSRPAPGRASRRASVAAPGKTPRGGWEKPPYFRRGNLWQGRSPRSRGD